MTTASLTSSSNAHWTKNPEALNIRNDAENVLKKVERDDWLEETSRTIPNMLVSGSAQTGSKSLGRPMNNPKKSGEIRHTEPVINDVRKKAKKYRVKPSRGIDTGVLNEAIKRAIRQYLDVKNRDNPAVRDSFKTFLVIMNKCLVGQQGFDIREYEIYAITVQTLSPYLIPDEVVVLDKLEKSAFTY